MITMKNAVRHMQNESSKEKGKKKQEVQSLFLIIFMSKVKKNAHFLALENLHEKKNTASVYRRVNVLARGEGTQRNTTFIYLCSLN